MGQPVRRHPFLSRSIQIQKLKKQKLTYGLSWQFLSPSKMYIPNANRNRAGVRNLPNRQAGSCKGRNWATFQIADCLLTTNGSNRTLAIKSGFELGRVSGPVDGKESGKSGSGEKFLGKLPARR